VIYEIALEERVIISRPRPRNRKLELTLGPRSSFNLEYTLQSGQVFRWEHRGEWWYGVVSGTILRVRQEGEWLRCESKGDELGSQFVRDYFGLDVDLEGVMASMPGDEVLARAFERFYGLRILRQERWECLASFLLATNANIPRIKKMVAAVCDRFGEPIEYGGFRASIFPRPEALAGASTKELRACGLGYRAPFLKRVSTSVRDGKVDFTELAALGYDEAKRRLLLQLLGEKLLLGVGPKVADCVLLYSLGKMEAFPIDVWIARELSNSYPSLVGRELARRLLGDRGAKLGRKDYDRISLAVRNHFGPFAGYAQQYLFMAARESGP
jgi:N-glycosylase/DNA lyase